MQQVHQLLCMQGIAINYSVFYLYLDTHQFKQLCHKLNSLISLEDDVRLYRCASLEAAQQIGALASEGIVLMNTQGMLL